MAKNNRLVTEHTADYRAVADPMREAAKTNAALDNLIAQADALADFDPIHAAVEGGAPITRLARRLHACIDFANEIAEITDERAELLHSLRVSARQRALARMNEVSSAEINKAVRSGKYGAPSLTDILVTR